MVFDDLLEGLLRVLDDLLEDLLVEALYGAVLEEETT